MKKVAIIGTAGVPARYGGFETLVHHLVQNLNEEFSLSIYCSNKFYKRSERVKYWNNARLFYLPFNANGVQSIIYDICSILHAIFYADTLIVLGVSGGIVIPLVKLFSKKKIIFNIDGLEWRRQKWGHWVRKFLKFSEKIAIKYSDADITDNEAIKRYTAMYYNTLSHLIEYGGNHCNHHTITNKHRKQYEFLKKPYAFKVCRIEPENNVHVILEAFSKIPSKVLVVVGNWENSTYGKELKNEYGKYKNIYLVDPIYDQYELDLLRSNCHVYIHGHSAGGTNPSLVEAMYLALPIIAFDISYNRATTENYAIYFKSANHLFEILKKTPLHELMELRTKMKLIADSRYSWRMIAKKYISLVKSFDYQYTKKEVNSMLSKLSENELRSQGIAHLKKPILFYEDLD